MDARHESVRALSSELGVSRQAIMNWLDNKTSPSVQNALALAAHYSEPIDSFLSDERKAEIELMQLSDAIAETATEHMAPKIKFEHSIESVTGTKPETHLCIPLYDEIAGGCGNGCINDEWAVPSEFMWVSQAWLCGITVTGTNHLVIIRARGDSMESTIHSGDLLLVDTSEPRTSAVIDGIYVIQRGEHTYVKRLQMLSSGIKIISDNPRYESEIASNDLQICGRVIWIWNGRKV